MSATPFYPPPRGTLTVTPGGEQEATFTIGQRPFQGYDSDSIHTRSTHASDQDGEEAKQEVSSTPPAPSGTIASVKAGPIAPSEATIPAKGRQRSAEQYIRLARPVLVKRLLSQLDHLAEHSRTPGAGVYVLQIERLAAEALERFFDDGFLDLLLAVRNALVINNQWMRYAAEDIRAMQAVIRKYADLPADNGLAFRRAALELNQLGIDTLPLELPTDLLLDEDESTTQQEGPAERGAVEAEDVSAPH